MKSYLGKFLISFFANFLTHENYFANRDLSSFESWIASFVVLVRSIWTHNGTTSFMYLINHIMFIIPYFPSQQAFSKLLFHLWHLACNKWFHSVSWSSVVLSCDASLLSLDSNYWPCRCVLTLVCISVLLLWISILLHLPNPFLPTLCLLSLSCLRCFFWLSIFFFYCLVCSVHGLFHFSGVVLAYPGS